MHDQHLVLHGFFSSPSRIKLHKVQALKGEKEGTVVLKKQP